MKKRTIAIAVLVTVGVLGTLAVVGFLLLGSLMSPRGGVEFDEPGVLVLDLDAAVVERAPPDLFAAELLGKHVELLDVALALDRAAEDDRIDAVLVKLRWPGYGWAKAEEIRARLERFRESGKPVHAWASVTNDLGYYVASAADSIWLLPGADVEINGFASRAPFVSRLLEKIGVDPQVVAIGAYKSAGDLLRRTDMSEPDRKATRAVLERIHANFVEKVVGSRGVDPERLESAMAEGVYTARDLEALGLVDGERHEGDLVRSMVAAASEDGEEIGVDRLAAHQIDLRDYADDLPDRAGPIGGTIALVYATGAITGGEGGFDPVFGQTMGADATVRMLRQVAADEEVSAAVLRIDSPGGDAFASEEIWAAVEELKEVMPVVVSMSDVAASGGYYIAAGADSIVAYPTTITGSIGVVAVLFNLREMWDKVGVDWDGVRTGPAADFPPTDRPLTDAEAATFERLVEGVYRLFVGRVSQGRGMSEPAVDEVAQGRVWTGAAAAERNLVDRLGGLDTALDVAKRAGGIDPETRVRLHVYPRQPTFFEQLRQAFRVQGLPATAGSPSVEAAAARTAARDLLRRIPGAALLLQDGRPRPMTVMPYTLEIQ